MMSVSEAHFRRKKNKEPVGNKPMPHDPADLTKAMFRQAVKKMCTEKAQKETTPILSS